MQADSRIQAQHAVRQGCDGLPFEDHAGQVVRYEDAFDHGEIADINASMEARPGNGGRACGPTGNVDDDARMRGGPGSGGGQWRIEPDVTDSPASGDGRATSGCGRFGIRQCGGERERQWLMDRIQRCHGGRGGRVDVSGHGAVRSAGVREFA